MINRKFLLGLAAGIIGSTLYTKYKDDIKPIAIKGIQGLLVFEEGTRNFVNEVSDEAKKIHEEKNQELIKKYQAMEMEQIKNQEEENQHNSKE